MERTEPGQGRPRDSELDAGADQRAGVAGAPAQHGRHGAGGHGRAAGTAPAREDRNVEPRSAHQHLLGRQLSGACFVSFRPLIFINIGFTVLIRWH